MRNRAVWSGTKPPQTCACKTEPGDAEIRLWSRSGERILEISTWQPVEKVWHRLCQKKDEAIVATAGLAGGTIWELTDIVLDGKPHKALPGGEARITFDRKEFNGGELPTASRPDQGAQRRRSGRTPPAPQPQASPFATADAGICTGAVRHEKRLRLRLPVKRLTPHRRRPTSAALRHRCRSPATLQTPRSSAFAGRIRC